MPSQPLPLPNFPQPISSRKINIITMQGNNNYQAGGDLLSASAFGWGSFDEVRGSVTFNANNTGNYTVQVLYPVSQAPSVANNNIVGVLGSAAPTGSNSVRLRWVAANGTEAANNTNLSSEFARLTMIGG